MFKYEILNRIAIFLFIFIATMWVLTGLWNWAMPVLGVAKLTFWQFTALFVIVHSLTIELVGFNKTKNKVEEGQ